MKSLLILILALALLAAAFFTRPTEEDFRRYFKDHVAAQPDRNWFERTFGHFSTDAFLDQCTYRNKYLWANIEHDGTIIYTGAFSHWIERNAKAQPADTTSSGFTTQAPAPAPTPDKKPPRPSFEVKRGK